MISLLRFLQGWPSFRQLPPRDLQPRPQVVLSRRSASELMMCRLHFLSSLEVIISTASVSDPQWTIADTIMVAHAF